ncbi:hypothetical protein [Streptomyces sp. MP131-18]|uniref:hypothetical protein n=1 Tax=Streptomyces sp. MP131-18 TaxID=1857892 RepID=UPI0009C9EE49|nr:hypothetical protein [Streptomyces sp. MP131-18]ONK13082.1 hypothetical protein STBA_38440 [Streptomyces sp. MP131-18]
MPIYAALGSVAALAALWLCIEADVRRFDRILALEKQARKDAASKSASGSAPQPASEEPITLGTWEIRGEGPSETPTEVPISGPFTLRYSSDLDHDTWFAPAYNDATPPWAGAISVETPPESPTHLLRQGATV